MKTPAPTPAYTHTADMVGADSRTRPDYRRTVCLVELKSCYKDEKGQKWSKSDYESFGSCYPIPRRNFPMFRLVNIQPVLRHDDE